MPVAKETGKDWLDRLLMAEGSVSFNTHFLFFSVGQVGKAFEEEDTLYIEELLRQVESDVGDLERAAQTLVAVARDMLANAQRTLAER